MLTRVGWRICDACVQAEPKVLCLAADVDLRHRRLLVRVSFPFSSAIPVVKASNQDKLSHCNVVPSTDLFNSSYL